MEWMIANFYYIADVTVAKRLRDLSGNPVRTPSFYGGVPGNADPNGEFWETRIILLENVTWLPTPDRATVVGNRLTLTFDAAMDGGRTPAASAFTVKVNGNVSASWSGAIPCPYPATRLR